MYLPKEPSAYGEPSMSRCRSHVRHGAEEVTMSYYWNAFVVYPAHNIYHRLTHLW